MKLQNKYSFVDKILMLIWLCRTKLICTNLRLIRFPIAIRGRKLMDFGHNLTTGVNCRFEAFSLNGTNDLRINFGRNIQINDNVHISAMQNVSIGDNTLLASHIYIADNSHGCYKGIDIDSDPNTPPIQRKYYVDPVRIGKNVWIGEGAIIMPGVTVGDGCVIGAHSIVNKSIASYSMAVGAPAKVVKKYSFIQKKWIINSLDS